MRASGPRLPFLAFLVLVGLTPPAVAQPVGPFGSEFQVNTYTTATQRTLSSEAVAADGSGNFVIAWQSYGQDGGTFEELIAPEAPADTATSGCFAWTVTGPPTGKARVRVSWTDDLAVSDASDVTFRIKLEG
jgi:hypothetical protein